MRVLNPAVEYVVNARWMLARAVHTALTATNTPLETLVEVTGMPAGQLVALSDEFANG